MTVVNIVALAAMFFGWVIFYTIYDWLFPRAPYTDEWTAFDFGVLGVIVLVGQLTAALVGWRLAEKIAAPLAVLSEAARSIAQGTFSTRATMTKRVFGEAERLLADFNTMAARLEAAEAELRYSNTAIAHELRTPLTVLRGRLQGLNDGVYVPSQQLFDSLLAHVDGLALLVEDLRTLGLFSANKLELAMKLVDLGSEADAVLQSVRPDLTAASIRVESNLRSIYIYADAARIRQALLALLENVRRYAHGSSVLVETEIVANCAVLRVADTGPGLPTDGYTRAFERFWRADTSRTRARGGSGLGLSVVRAIAESHGGEATIRGHKDGGTVVDLSLPLNAETTIAASTTTD
ncbi:histidine kinase [Ensifer sp. Root31]|uniref:ATP-binding protein n=1 Tax=Ensifer sp. Root31 TaxID=1736512 RepID=UPI0007108728|nr:ATP-binding protein [Ensifer sp. Root31]KQU83906.1 histidine kinase [Ensifer sp. Root31]